MIKKNGITLIENVIAITLLGILIVTMVYSFASARMYAASARHRHQAINIARSKAEEIIRTGVLEGTTAPADATISELNSGKLSITYDPTTAPDPAISILSITITVSWKEKMWKDVDQQESIVLLLNTTDAEET